MTKRKPSGDSSTKASKKRAFNLGDSILRGLEEVAAHKRGDMKLRTRVVQVPDEVDVRAIREQADLTQAQFAERYGFSQRTLQEWEQGRTKPDNAVRAYLTVIARNPKAVQEALQKAS